MVVLARVRIDLWARLLAYYVVLYVYIVACVCARARVLRFVLALVVIEHRYIVYMI